MTVLGIASLVILLLEFATRVIELFLVIRSALLTRRERSATSKPKPPKRSESRGEHHLPAARPYYTKRSTIRKKSFGPIRELRWLRNGFAPRLLSRLRYTCLWSFPNEYNDAARNERGEMRHWPVPLSHFPGAGGIMADLEGGTAFPSTVIWARRTPPRLSNPTRRSRSPRACATTSCCSSAWSERCSRSTIRPSALSSTVCSTA